MPRWTLVEPCCGSAALSLHLLGARRALLPYQGSKWRFRHSLQARVEALGFTGTPACIQLTDPGPWGHTLAVVLNPARRAALVAQLEGWAQEDPREVYDRTHGAPVARDRVTAAAQHLFLQRLAFSGKAVGTRDGRWSSPGFNTSSAYGLEGTSRFGAVHPMVPSMIRVLESYDRQLDAEVEIQVRAVPAEAPGELAYDTLVYLDPPYAGTTAYPNGALTRAEVAELAVAWRSAGAAVIVSEQHGIPLEDWQRQQLYSGRSDTSPFRGKQPEWVTWSGPPRAIGGASRRGPWPTRQS